MTTEPAFLAAARVMAAESGINVNDWLERHRREVLKAENMAEGCIKSSEVQVLVQERMLPAERLIHIENCPDCLTGRYAIAEPMKPRASR